MHLFLSGRFCGETHPPSWMAVQLVEDGVIAVLEDQVKLPFASKHFDQIHQVGVFQLLHRQKTEIPNRHYKQNLLHRGVAHQSLSVSQTH